jgi:hypothetical protein
MISDVDRSLIALLEHEVAQFRTAREHDTKIPVKLENADTPLSGNPVVSVFLYDIREDVSLRDVTPTTIRNAESRVTGRRPPPRYFRLSYLVSVIAEEPQTEHWVLGELLSALMLVELIPETHLRGVLVEEKVRLTKALPLGSDRSVGDLWTALGRKLRPALELVVTAPLRREVGYTTAPPPQHGRVHINTSPPLRDVEPRPTRTDEAAQELWSFVEPTDESPAEPTPEARSAASTKSRAKDSRAKKRGSGRS